MILDHDVPPDGEAQGQPDGHRVDHQREVDVEQDDHAPAVAQLQSGGGEVSCYLVKFPLKIRRKTNNTQVSDA